jgi:predicted component of viral defense system (DUF524 family)
MAVEIHPAYGVPRVLVFDPKYKLEGEVIEDVAPNGSPKKVDIDTMHAYRDAIRDEQGRRVVDYAVILYPGPEVRFDDGLEAMLAVPGMEQHLEGRLAEVLSAALSEQHTEKHEGSIW